MKDLFSEPHIEIKLDDNTKLNLGQHKIDGNERTNSVDLDAAVWVDFKF